MPIPENWPFPVRIHSFGHFALVIDDQPLTIDTKAKNKPLEMLKTLLAPAGRDVSDSALADHLWPDAEGDRALQNFTITLHRLRKLIGYPHAILLKDRRVCLNPDLCWVDIWMLQHLIARADKALDDRKSTVTDLKNMAHRLQAAYRGQFLNAEQAPWAMNLRRQFHGRWSQTAEQLAKRLEHACRWKPALQLYRHGLQIDATAEWACEGALRCGLQLRQFGEALRVYERFSTCFKQTYGSAPSSQIETLRRQLQNQVRKQTL
jgi:DNA-binding SARP family transcriptional activator